MRRKLTAYIGLLCVTAASWTGEPWKDKASTSWSESDLKKILEDSPWSKTISVPATWLRTGAQGPEAGVKISIPQPPRDPDHREDPDLKIPPLVHDKLYNQFARFLLRWESSRTIRTALRLQALRQPSSASTIGAKKSTKPPDPAADLPEYELLLIGDSFAPFPIASESKLKANTVLQLKDSNISLSPTRVIPLRRDDGQILEARFFFRKATPSGRPTIPAAEKTVEFQCSVGGTFLRAKFEPARMVDSQGPDLR